MIAITASTAGIRRTAHRYRDGYYRCFPRSENRKRFARSFSSLSDAAAFLALNPTWGIRVREGYAIIYRRIRMQRA